MDLANRKAVPRAAERSDVTLDPYLQSYRTISVSRSWSPAVLERLSTISPSSRDTRSKDVCGSWLDSLDRDLTRKANPLTCMILVVTLYLMSESRNGLGHYTGTNHYTWRYGPTVGKKTCFRSATKLKLAVITIVHSMSRQVTPANRTVCLDYLFAFQPAVLYTGIGSILLKLSVRRSILMFRHKLSLKIVVSTSLLLTRPATVTTSCSSKYECWRDIYRDSYELTAISELDHRNGDYTIVHNTGQCSAALRIHAKDIPQCVHSRSHVRGCYNKNNLSVRKVTKLRLQLQCYYRVTIVYNLRLEHASDGSYLALRFLTRFAGRKLRVKQFPSPV
ncbi:hypothetical protein D6D05_04936 [Aureobasidium pullulans]|nr:hypothetical protein D6D05_04936 [Aureobasidium pullulans]